MKQATKKTELTGWKQDLFDSIIQTIDRMKDNIENAENDTELIEKAFTEFESDLQVDIETVEIEAKEFASDSDFVNDLFSEVRFNHFKDWDLDNLLTMFECNGWQVIKCESLAEQMKFEAFKEDLEANPYQLKLIA